MKNLTDFISEQIMRESSNTNDSSKKIASWFKEDEQIILKLKQNFGNPDPGYKYSGKEAKYTFYTAGDHDKEDFLYRLTDSKSFSAGPSDNLGEIVLNSKLAKEYKGQRCIIIDAWPNDIPDPKSDEEYMDNVSNYIYLVDSNKLIFYHQTVVKEDKKITDELQHLIDSIGI